MIEDRRGSEITTEHGGSFVQVEQAGLTPGRTIKYKGLVTGIEHDAKGPLLVIQIWHHGGLGHPRTARPRDCVVIQAPRAIREMHADRARREIAARRKVEETEHQKRMVALQKERS